MPLALRIYETENCQRAIFTDVVGFRDMAIPIRVKRINTQEKHGFMEYEGVRKATTFQATSVDWFNPDVTENQKLLEKSTKTTTNIFIMEKMNNQWPY